ncbi:TetR/AcrR family transcriptional regulator [Pseudonocardiaceae bacterium YIM PH 21723]|nr:TetR/AcrR family transcriptional regulator [Pseudonocardiaceae bacterium YIM PH 21723]
MTEADLRAPQQDRSRITRQRLLEAAVICLANQGWAGSTVSVVAERAGVSRGAAQHHFPTREALFTAAVEFMTKVRYDELRRRVDRLPGPLSRRDRIVFLMEQMVDSPLFRAALHLWVAAASDPALKEQIVKLELYVGRETHRTAVDFLGVDESVPGVRETVQATLDLMRGLGLANLLTDDSARRSRIIQQWASTVDAALPD